MFWNDPIPPPIRYARRALWGACECPGTAGVMCVNCARKALSGLKVPSTIRLDSRGLPIYRVKAGSSPCSPA